MRKSFRYCAAAAILLGIAATLPLGAHAQEPELGRLLDRIIEAYGGEENLAKLDNQVQEWSVVALMGGRHGVDARRIKVPGQLKVELTYPGRKETRIISRETSFVTFGDAPARVAMRAQHDAMRLQLMRLYSPLVLRGKFDALSLSYGETGSVITLFEHGVRVDYFVNSDNWRIETVVGSLPIQGTEMQFRTEYSDFAFHDGVLVHRKENKFAGSVNTAVLQLRRVTLDADLGDSDFLPADGGDSESLQDSDEII